MTKWIRCEDELPKSGIFVLTRTPFWSMVRVTDIMLTGYYFASDTEWFAIHFDQDSKQLKSYKINPTHWQELPEPPHAINEKVKGEK
jgi:Protein of unknown function (DUF551)